MFPETDSLGKTVLLIDSNEKLRELRARLLRRYGVHVVTADGLEAARGLEASTYDLVLIAPRENPEEAIQLQLKIKRLHPAQRVGFFVGPPKYISFTYGRNVVPMPARSSTWADKVDPRFPVSEDTWQLLRRALDEYGFIPDEEQHEKEVRARYPEFNNSR